VSAVILTMQQPNHVSTFASSPPLLSQQDSPEQYPQLIVLISGNRSLCWDQHGAAIAQHFHRIQQLFIQGQYVFADASSSVAAVSHYQQPHKLFAPCAFPSLLTTKITTTVADSHSIGPQRITLVHGGASGADAIGDRIARLLGWQVVSCPADWSNLGRKAGILRNQDMIDQYQPHVFLAFPKGPSPGTRDCIRRVEKYKQHPSSRLLYCQVDEMK